MLQLISLILNLPYTLTGIILALSLFPKSVIFASNPYRIVFKVRRDSFGFDFKKGWRGMTMCNVIILNNLEQAKDLEHEIIHVKQFQSFPLIFPILYTIELWKHGYRNNKYEDEAYSGAGNIYKKSL